MPSLRLAQAIVIPVVIPALMGAVCLPPVALAQSGSASTVILASDIGGRGVVAPGSADFAQGRVDRTIVTPFDPARRVIVRPKGLESAAAPRAAAPRAAAIADIRPAPPTAAVAPLAASDFVDVGPLDLSAPPPVQAVPQPGIIATRPFVAVPDAAAPAAAAQGAFLHVGSYDDPPPGTFPSRAIPFTISPD